MAHPELDADTAEMGELVFLRDPKTQAVTVIPDTDATPEQRNNAYLGAKQRKATFDYRRAGALARAGLLPRQITASLAAGTVNHMFALILQGELQPATAKEAAEIAKAANEVYKLAAGALDAKDMSPHERAAAQQLAVDLGTVLAQRAKQADAPLGGAVPAGQPIPEVDADEWED